MRLGAVYYAADVFDVAHEHHRGRGEYYERADKLFIRRFAHGVDDRERDRAGDRDDEPVPV